MSNPFFYYPNLTALRLVPKTLAQAEDCNSIFDAASSGFDLVYAVTQRCLRLAANDSVLAELPALATLKGKVLYFNATTGAPEGTVIASSAQMDAAVAAATAAAASAAAAAASAAAVAALTQHNALAILNYIDY